MDEARLLLLASLASAASLDRITTRWFTNWWLLVAVSSPLTVSLLAIRHCHLHSSSSALLTVPFLLCLIIDPPLSSILHRHSLPPLSSSTLSPLRKELTCCTCWLRKQSNCMFVSCAKLYNCLESQTSKMSL